MSMLLWLQAQSPVTDNTDVEAKAMEWLQRPLSRGASPSAPTSMAGAPGVQGHKGASNTAAPEVLGMHSRAMELMLSLQRQT